MMRLPVVFLFGGQGSHYTRMGADLYAHDALFGSWCRRLDAVAADLLGESALETVWRVPGDGSWACDRLAATHPAIFIVQYALCRRLMAAGVHPDYLLGASLGETVAASISGALDPEQAVALLCRQALGVERHCPPGGMLAIVDSPDLFRREAHLWQHTVIAAFNHPRHFVVSAQRSGLDAALAFLAGTQVLHQELPVRYAFHSSWVEAAAPSFRAAAQALNVGRCDIALLSPAYECRLEHLPDTYFWDVARRPVYFERTLRALERTGPHLYVDCSPSGTLDGFVRQILPAGTASTSVATLSPFGDDMRRLSVALQRIEASREPARLCAESESRP